MAKHPQNSHRGMFSKSAIAVGSTGIFSPIYSDGTAIMTFESTGNLNLVAGVSLSGSGKDITQDSTGVLDIPAGILPSSKSTAAITGDSTGVVLAAGALTILSGSTGVILAANSTGFTIDGAQISTA